MNQATETKKLHRRDFLKGAAASAGGLAFAKWAMTNVDAVAQEGQQYVIVADVIRGGGAEPQGPSCAQTNIYAANEELVFRAVLFDGATGELLNTPEAIEARGISMNVTIEGLTDSLEMSFGPHPPNREPAEQVFYWSEAFIVAADVSGKFKYQLSVQDANGGTGTLELLGIPGIDTFPRALELNEV